MGLLEELAVEETASDMALARFQMTGVPLVCRKWQMVAYRRRTSIRDPLACWNERKMGGMATSYRGQAIHSHSIISRCLNLSEVSNRTMSRKWNRYAVHSIVVLLGIITYT